MKSNFLRKLSVTASALPIVMMELEPKLIMISGRYGILNCSSRSNQFGLMMVNAL